MGLILWGTLLLLFAVLDRCVKPLSAAGRRGRRRPQSARRAVAPPTL